MRELKHELRIAEKQAERVAREGEAREPLLARLEQHFSENRFAERLVQGMEQTRRRPT
jgi:hypothetical protein